MRKNMYNEVSFPEPGPDWSEADPVLRQPQVFSQPGGSADRSLPLEAGHAEGSHREVPARRPQHLHHSPAWVPPAGGILHTPGQTVIII